MPFWTTSKVVGTSAIVGVTGLALLAHAREVYVRSVFRCPTRARATEVGARTILQAARLHLDLDDVPAGACPTLQDLVDARRLERGKTLDAWARSYRVACVDGVVRVASDGPDRAPGTGDDIVAVGERVEEVVSRGHTKVQSD